MAEGWTNGMHSAHRNHTDLLNHTYEGKTTDHRNEVVNQKENNNGGRTGHSHSLLRSGPGLLYRETELYHLQRQISQL